MPTIHKAIVSMVLERGDVVVSKSTECVVLNDIGADVGAVKVES